MAQITRKLIFILGSIVGFIVLYFAQGKHLLSALVDKVERVGKRHYMPYSYTYYKSKQHEGDNKKTIRLVLAWISIALIFLGLLAVFGMFD